MGTADGPSRSPDFEEGRSLVSGNGAQWDLRGAHADLDDAIQSDGMSPVFQPIVSLPAATQVGYEALAGWPHQAHLGPQSVFAYAAATQRVTELDRLCIDRAVDVALRGGLTKGSLLGVNSEPASDYTGPADSEGIENDEHFEQAFAWGATLGQGFLFGRPGPLPQPATTAAWSPPDARPCARRNVNAPFATPFDVVADNPEVRTARKRLLVAISQHLEEQERNSQDTPIVLTALQDGVNSGLPTPHRYAALAAACPLVAVFGSNADPHQPAGGVRTVVLDPGDPVCAEWVVVTHDRTVVTAVATALLSRMP